MLLIRLSADDIALTRFAVSPLGETVAAARLLLASGTHAVHLSWIRWARAELARDPIDLGLIAAMFARPHVRPHFLTPAPDTRMPDFDDELDELRRTRAADVRASMTRTFGRPGDLPAPLRPLYDDPDRELPRLADDLRSLWTRLIAPHWPRIARVLDADIAHRGRRLADLGIGGLAPELDPSMSWTADGLALLPWVSPDCELRASEGGLVLMPSVFGWPTTKVKMSTTTYTTLRYPARGVGGLWEHQARPPVATAPLTRLLGRPRATILYRLATPGSPADLARDLRVTPSAVSQHLAALLAARLVARERRGRTVLYLRTPLADALCEPDPAGARPVP
ncbi:ArsR family transcriptional regulator [Rugosimonospora africana]|uniref:ArsR family transcriptional regulator n=1 Tax=Rugosimonospora africana TaxID=556532 RepID=A0A8J3R2B0_9ACTN|nr:ArsR family transcriptional regulator [Rugosimonospora africana]GIH20474.1 ArsR family transcriptional regulator [Rugosimonospora africana]